MRVKTHRAWCYCDEKKLFWKACSLILIVFWQLHWLSILSNVGRPGIVTVNSSVLWPKSVFVVVYIYSYSIQLPSSMTSLFQKSWLLWCWSRSHVQTHETSLWDLILTLCTWMAIICWPGKFPRNEWRL